MGAPQAYVSIDATIDTLKESILGELWPEERSVLTGLGPAAARSSDAAVAPAPAPPAATEEAAAPTEYVADETRDAALAADATARRAATGRALRDYQKEGVAWLLYNWHQRRSSILPPSRYADAPAGAVGTELKALVATSRMPTLAW